MAYCCDAFTRDQEETKESQERDGDMANDLTLTNEIASKRQRKQERDEAKPDGLTQTNEQDLESD